MVPFVVGGLILLGIVAVVVALHRPQAAYPAHSPQRAVQRYLGLLQSGKVEEAYGMTNFSMTAIGTYTNSDFHQQWDNWSNHSHEVSLLHVANHGETAAVTVQITTDNAGVFGSQSNGNRTTFTLLRLHGTWFVTGPVYAYIP
jgi:hypothetical protein